MACHVLPAALGFTTTQKGFIAVGIGIAFYRPSYKD
jgi:hypothetical protein